MFPVSWAAGKRKSSDDAFEGTPFNPPHKRKHKPVQSSVASIEKIKGTIERLAALAPDNATEDMMTKNIEMLDNIPFRTLIGRTTMNSETSNIPLVSRVYEERFMRECKNKREQPCVMASQCECMLIDSVNGFIGVQFEIPGVSSSNQDMCVLCLRKCTTLLFYKTIYNGVNAQGVIQKFGNFCNQYNEYHPSAMLCCPVNGPMQCMPMPIVAHQRNRYSVVLSGGIKHLKQHGVYMEDF